MRDPGIRRRVVYGPHAGSAGGRGASTPRLQTVGSFEKLVGEGLIPPRVHIGGVCPVVPDPDPDPVPEWSRSMTGDNRSSPQSHRATELSRHRTVATTKKRRHKGLTKNRRGVVHPLPRPHRHFLSRRSRSRFCSRNVIPGTETESSVVKGEGAGEGEGEAPRTSRCRRPRRS